MTRPRMTRLYQSEKINSGEAAKSLHEGHRLNVSEMSATGCPAAHVRIQDCGGTTATIRAGINVLKEMAEKCLSQKREEVDIRDLVVSLECGGSDATSGISANPLVGWVSDRIISLGATAILSETPEMIGAEHILSGRGVDPGVGKKLKRS